MIMHQLQERRVVLISQDSFYRGLTPEELKNVKDYNFDHPNAMDQQAILQARRRASLRGRAPPRTLGSPSCRVGPGIRARRALCRPTLAPPAREHPSGPAPRLPRAFLHDTSRLAHRRPLTSPTAAPSPALPPSHRPTASA